MIGQRAQGNIPNSPGVLFDILLLGFNLILRNVRILYIALLPKRLVMNEVMLSPTWNRRYVAEIERLSSL